MTNRLTFFVFAAASISFSGCSWLDEAKDKSVPEDWYEVEFTKCELNAEGNGRAEYTVTNLTDDARLLTFHINATDGDGNIGLESLGAPLPLEPGVPYEARGGFRPGDITAEPILCFVSSATYN